MKILIPTAKEMQTSLNPVPTKSYPLSKPLLELLVEARPDELQSIFNISEAAAQKEYLRFQDIKNQTASFYPAILLFNGLMYRQINREFTPKKVDYLKQHVFITSSLYGIINALDPIPPHRLDFHSHLKPQDKSLKSYWRAAFDQAIGDEPVLSLLSSEFEGVFSPNIAKQFIHCSFFEEKEGKLKKHSTISKKARGHLLSAIIDREYQDIDRIKKLTFANFHYKDDLSTDKEWVFVNKIKE